MEVKTTPLSRAALLLESEPQTFSLGSGAAKMITVELKTDGINKVGLILHGE